jgi:predicted alpha/beta superfamily hydrolase
MRSPAARRRAPLRASAVSFALSLIAAAPLAARAADAPVASPPCASTATGDLHVHTLDSRIFGNTRKIRVLLPPDYDLPANAAVTYPVLYLLDGQNLFDRCLSDVSHEEWGVDETVYRLIREKKIPPMIVVGVDHAGKDRAKEYLPYRDFVGNPEMEEPEGKRFPDFMTREVMPLVDGRYRTKRDAYSTGIGGSSYGGVATLYALLAKPNRFGYGLIESPTLWIGMGQLVRDTSPLVALPKRVFVAFGGKEGDDPKIIEKMVGLIRVVEHNFREAGYDEGSFRFVFEPDARHDEIAWAKRLPGALTFLYGN